MLNSALSRLLLIDSSPLTLAGQTQLSTAKTAGTLLTTTANVRKRILDDRTNNVKPAPINSTSAATTKPIIKQIPTARRAAVRKPTDSAMVLEDLAVNEPTVKSRPIKPLKRNTAEPAPRRAAVVAGKKKATSADPRPAPTRSSVLVKVASTNGISGTQRATRRASGRGVLEAKAEFEDGRAAKKPRTSEPNELEKENADLKAEDEEVEEELAGPASKPAKPTINSESRPAELKEGEEGWEDLDEGDEDDPLMVKEYVNEIYTYMRELEVSIFAFTRPLQVLIRCFPQLETLPASDYMSRQNELTWKMRGVLVDWIIEVHSKFRLLPETLFLAINLMDRFLTKRTVALIKFQLVGVTALFLAAKYEEVICPSVSNFLYMTDGGYDSDEILKAETYMLEMLEWDLRYPNPLNFLRRVSKADQYDIQSRTFAKVSSPRRSSDLMIGLTYLTSLCSTSWRSLLSTTGSLLPRPRCLLLPRSGSRANY